MTVRVVVVGAGTAGCAVASTLSGNPHFEVIVLEAGTTRNAAPADLFAAMAEPDRTWPSLHVRNSPSLPASSYLRGRGVGGSGSINGRVVQTGRPRDYDEWAALSGCNDWHYALVEPYVLDELRRATAVVGQGPVDRLVEAWAASNRQLCTPTMLHARPSLASVGTATLRTGQRVERVLVENDIAYGVELADGTVVPADIVVVSAGALFSPAILLRSGLDRPGIGQNLHDHFGVAVSFSVDDTSTYEVTGSVVNVERNGIPLQVLPLNRTSAEPGTGAVFVGVMQQWSRGAVTVDSGGEPIVTFNTVADARDAVALDVATELLHEVTSPLGDSASNIYPASYYHAAGTCRMGAANDPLTVVDSRCAVIGVDDLYVIDASIFPNQPAANPYVPTLAVARLAASRISASLG